MAAPTPIGIKAAIREAVRMKSGLVGFGIIASLFVVAGVVQCYAPYDVVRNWSKLAPWQDNPRYAAPEWSDIFTGKHEPRTTIFEPDTFRKNIIHTTIPNTNINITIVNLTKTFFWDADNFPSEISIAVNATFPGQSPLIEVGWARPDLQFVPILVQSIPDSARNRSLVLTSTSSSIVQIQNNIRTWILNEGVIPQSVVTNSTQILPEVTLLARNDTAQLSGRNAHLQKGFYELVVRYTGFSDSDDVNGRLILYGTVYGIAGTDQNRRDLLTGLLWGAPIALAFGLIAGGAVALIQTVLGALSGWYGGPIDTFVQRFADFYLIIPTLPILIMISLFYRPGIVALLFYLVAFGIVGSTTKVVRSIVLQIKEEQFIEAAQSYGASRGRILFKYIMPRIMPYTFALVALSVPAFIFVEASLSFLGLGDPVLPTWGSIIGQAYDQGALFYGWWWWIAFPAAGIIYTTIGFALLGYAFDKVLNPRLREE